MVETADKGEVTDAGLQQMPRREIAGALVMDADIVGAGIGNVAHADDIGFHARTERPHRLADGAVHRADQQAGDILRQQRIDQGRLPLGIVARVADDSQVAGFIGQGFEVGEQLGKERVRRVVHDGAEQVRTAGAQPRRAVVADETDFAGNPAHHLLRLRGHAAIAAQRIRHRRRGNPGGARNVLDARLLGTLHGTRWLAAGNVRRRRAIRED